jgi:2-oxoglutarate ferredoxin oxidoreductase subunit alpha
MDNQLPYLNWKITGKAGEGVMLAAKLFAQVVKRHGLADFTYLEYPSLIKGGHQTGQVYAHAESATCQKRKIEALIAINQDGMRQHTAELTAETIVIYNSDAGPVDQTAYRQITQHIFELPLFSLSKENTGDLIATNIICVALSAHLYGLDINLTKQSILDDLAGKPQEIIDKDLKAFDIGLALAQEKLPQLKTILPSQDNKILVNGNEAIGLGALAGGCQFFSAYPMTPASALLHFMAEQQKNYPVVVKHAEDEIAAINQAIGASFAGVRAMTGTSGGGLALMTEAVSLASITETPLVIMNGQRVGPATGLPTWTEQADLSFVLTMGHGEIQRVVLTPGTIAEHFALTKLAFHLAEKYQIPVFVMSDKFALESYHSLVKPDDLSNIERQSLAEATDLPEDNSYRRYKITENGISKRSYPSQPHGLNLTNSYEHDEYGYATEDAQPTINQVDKRTRKMNGILSELPAPVLIGPAQADVTLVGWGSTILVLQEVIKQLAQQPINKTVNVIHLPSVWPFPAEAFTNLAKNAQKLVMIEGNSTGQAEKLIRQETGITFSDRVHRYDGRPFYAEDLIDYLSK